LREGVLDQVYFRGESAGDLACTDNVKEADILPETLSAFSP
jgi:hypothetical protein